MQARSPFILAALVLGSTLPLSIVHKTAAAPAAKAKVLYQANWKGGLKASKWKVFKGFKVSKSMLTYDGSNDAGAFAPFKTKGLKNYAVEVREQLGTPTKPNLASYDVFVHRAYNNAKSGIFGGYDVLAGEPNAKNVADLYWNGAQSDFVPGAALTPDTLFHTYRLEVRGTLYRFLADGKELVPWTVIADDASFNGVGLTFTYFPAKVKSFKVLALSSSTVTSNLDTGVLASRALLSTDVPVPPLAGVFRDNNQYSLDSGISLTNLQSIGRVYGYLETFENAQTYVSQSLNQHSNAAGAKQVYDLFVQGVRANSTSDQNYIENDTSTLGIGEESFSFSFQYDFQGAPSYVTEVLFHRGSYYEAIYVDSSDKTVSATASTIAQTADKELQAKGA